jgi:hypothetical protein
VITPKQQTAAINDLHRAIGGEDAAYSDFKLGKAKPGERYLDEVRFLIDASDVDIYNKVAAGQFDMATSTIPCDILKVHAGRRRAGGERERDGGGFLLSRLGEFW